MQTIPPPTSRNIVNPLPPIPAPASGKYQQAARTSWMAPLVAFGLNAIGGAVPDHTRTAALVMGCASALIYLVGLVCAVVAMYGWLKKGAKGVLAGAITGMILNLGILALFVAVLISANSLRAKVAQNDSPAAFPPPALPLPSPQPQARPMASLPASGGAWHGVARRGPVTVSATLFADSSDDAAQVTSQYNARFSVMMLSVDNSAGDSSIAVDPDTAYLQMNGGEFVKTLPTWRMYATAKSNAAQLQRKFACKQLIPAHGRQDSILLFLPDHTDVANLRSVRIEVDADAIQIVRQ